MRDKIVFQKSSKSSKLGNIFRKFHWENFINDYFFGNFRRAWEFIFYSH